jgi:hypothetical protein
LHLELSDFHWISAANDRLYLNFSATKSLRLAELFRISIVQAIERRNAKNIPDSSVSRYPIHIIDAALEFKL